MKRSVLEIMILAFTFVIALALLGLTAAIVIVEINTPEADTALLANALTSMVSGLGGVLIGLIGGSMRSNGRATLTRRVEDDK